MADRVINRTIPEPTRAGGDVGEVCHVERRLDNTVVCEYAKGEVTQMVTLTAPMLTAFQSFLALVRAEVWK